MAKLKEDVVTQALRTPEGTRALLEAMREPIRRIIDYRERGVEEDLTRADFGVYYDIEQWILPCLKTIEKSKCDQQLFGFTYCLMGSIATRIEMRMYEMALEELDVAIAQIEGYQEDDVNMEPLGGDVMPVEVMRSISHRLQAMDEMVEISAYVKSATVPLYSQDDEQAATQALNLF